MKVAVAVIIASDGRVLITQRPSHASHGGQWEFPGGKLENNENGLTALIREVKEEVGLHVLDAEFLTELEHTYGVKKVNLLVYLVTNYQGKARCCELQIDLRWVHLNDLGDYDFPEANAEIIRSVKSRSFHFSNLTEESSN